MNRLIGYCYLCALLSIGTLVASKAVSSDESQSRQALLIGIRNYSRLVDKDLKALNYADRDALIVGSALEADSGVLEPLSLINSEADATTIRTRASHLPHSDVLFALFSGHATISAKDGRLYLLPSEAKSLDATSGILAIDLIRWLVNTSAGRVVLFLDACSSGAVISELERSDVDRSRVLVFASSQEGEESYEDPDSQRPSGIFSYFLVKGLQGGADGALDGKPDGLVTAGELRAYLDKKIRERCNTLSFKQTPNFSQSTIGNPIVLSTVKAGQALTPALLGRGSSSLEKVLLKLSESRLHLVGHVPESFEISRMIPEWSKVTADGKFFVGCEDRPARSFLVPLEVPKSGRSFDLGIDVASESSGYLADCKIRESPDSKYVATWAKSSEGRTHTTLYSLTIPPTKLMDFQGPLSFFYKDRFVEVNGTILEICPLANPTKCEILRTPQPVTNVTFGGTSRRGMMGPPPIAVFQSISAFCSQVGCQLETGSGNWEDPDKVFKYGGMAQPDPRSSGIRERLKDSLFTRVLPSGDAAAVMKSGDIFEFRDSLLERCCLLETEQNDFAIFAAGGKSEAVVATQPTASDGTKAGLIVEMFQERKRTAQIRLHDLEKLNVLICSKSGNIVVAADEKTSLLLTFKNGQFDRQRSLHCSSPVAIDESDTWVACADFNIPRIQIENITTGKVTELEKPTKPLETIIIGKGFVSASGLFRMGPHSPKAHIIAWRLSNGERINPIDCPLAKEPEQIGYINGGSQLMLLGTSLASVNPLSCDLRDYGTVPGGSWNGKQSDGTALQFASFANISVKIGPSQGPWIGFSTYPSNMVIINNGDYTASMFSAGGNLGKMSIAPDGRDVLVSLGGHIAQFPLDLKSITALTLRQLGREFTAGECSDLFPAGTCPTRTNLAEQSSASH